MQYVQVLITNFWQIVNAGRINAGRDLSSSLEMVYTDEIVGL
jgi:hypothetical protein